MSLRNSTHVARVDAVLRRVLLAFVEVFPARACSVYIEGSFADGSGISSSDLDLKIILKDSFIDVEEQNRAAEFMQFATTLAPLELDIEVIDEQSLLGGVSPLLKLGSLLVYGEDMLQDKPIVPLIQWARDRMHSSYWRTIHLFGRSLPLHSPLTFPDPAAEFYGYDRRKWRLENGEEVNCTRDLIRLVSWSATGILAFKAGRYVVRKRDCHKVYQACFSDEWGQLLQDIYELCRNKWHYLIPVQADERRALRAICERTLAFENHFLQIYKEFLLQELSRADPQGQQFALDVLRRFPYQDAELEQAIRSCSPPTA
ncbi:hypothetical protein EPA93_40970 [Ktedonosporobacter rubrisoli]|uniref:Nucleotidyltransferase domain-containing protein n=1 Tax=Ktedonosporobacter rubrisoli TaxID=2509675 RepID=A0A4P6K1P6_KTERU|nr:hypothetical protein [Ktedonosporobacter rubrisoli]QBD82014.1 hypothetical protein EPA93_40970 [Ktedonosporobacter rubrisoli]